jgi:coenzyme F420-0:L-glutamate ligase/coenzyme F420-1:gamma-L-glutamate ligase
MIEIVPLTTLGEIAPSQALSPLLAEALDAAAIVPRSHDVLVVSQKIVSKAENRFVDLRTIVPGAAARRLAAKTGKDRRLVEVILSESMAVVRAAPGVLITRHRTGHVMANAGVDQSNLGRADSDTVLLLPRDADESAAHIRVALGARFATPPAVVVSDSFGRPWRQGVVNVAIGASGLPALEDRRGDLDRDGRRLQVTQVALADLLACAAGLTFGEGAEGIPVALVRGVRWRAHSRPAGALVRPLEQDLFQ